MKTKTKRRKQKRPGFRRLPGMVAMERKRKPNRYGWEPCLEQIVPYGFPFIIKRHLIHRVRLIDQHLDGNGRPTHTSCLTWCGSGGFPDRNDTMADPPAGRLLCARCEAKAVEAGQPTADAMLGRHIHTGRMVPIQTCHTDERQRN